LSKPTLGDRQIGFSSGKHGGGFCFHQATSPSPAEKVTLHMPSALRATPVARIVRQQVLEENPLPQRQDFRRHGRALMSAYGPKQTC
jgi:hypothetical protein